MCVEGKAGDNGRVRLYHALTCMTTVVTEVKSEADAEAGGGLAGAECGIDGWVL